MEEIVLAFSSIAGACTAVALDKIPKIKRNKQQVPTINSAITSQLHSLRMEKEILSKTITRIHQQESDVNKIQKDKLLLRYQHQLGTIIAKIERLEAASKYPDLGPIGDSLISLMDNKLSQLDQRLHEISSKITVTSQTKQIEKPTPTLEIPQEKKIEPKVDTHKEKIEIKEEKTVKPERIQEWLPPMEVPSHDKHRTVELSTLTEITGKPPQFPSELIRPVQAEPQIPQITEPKVEPVQTLKITESIVEEIVITSPQPIIQDVIETLPEIKQDRIQPEPERKIQLPTPIKIPEEERLEDDDKDLDKIKSEIMKALSKLEQVEVE